MHKPRVEHRHGRDVVFSYRDFQIERKEILQERDGKPPLRYTVWQVMLEGQIVATNDPRYREQCVETLQDDNYQGCKRLIDRLLDR